MSLAAIFEQVGNEEEDEEEGKGAEGGAADQQSASAPSAAEQEGGRLTAEHLSQLMWDQVRQIYISLMDHVMWGGDYVSGSRRVLGRSGTRWGPSGSPCCDELTIG